MATADYEFHIDWNNDDDFSGAGEDVTGRILSRDTVSIAYGRDQARAFSPIKSGEASFALNNVSRDYSPENGSSPLAGNIKPSRPVRIQATHQAQTHILYRGFTDQFDILPERTLRSVQVGCLDVLARHRDVRISTELHSGIQTGDAIGIVLDEIGWPTGDRDIDTGATTIRYWWENDVDAFTALERIVASEGPPALVTVDVDGNFVFRDRHHRITRSASSSSQATFRDIGTEPLFSAPLIYDHGWRDIVNSVSVEVPERVVDPALSVVWETEDTFSIDASSSRVFHVETSEPFTGAVTPSSGAGFEVVSGSVTSVTLSRTSGQSTIITLTAGGSGATVSTLSLQAYAVPVARTYRITAEDATSQSDYGIREMPSGLQPVWAGRNDAQAIADLLILQRADRLPIVNLRMANANDTRLAQQLGRDLSDRVTIVDAETGLNDDFFIEQIKHQIDEGGRFHSTFLGCEKAPAAPTSGFILDTSELNAGVLGY